MPTATTPPTPPPPGPPPRRVVVSQPAKPDPLKTSIETIRKNAAQLNELTDHAGRTVQMVETFLNETCSIGVSAYVSFRLYSEGGGMFLEYRRVGPRFRIAIVESDTGGDDEDVKPWSDSPRELKLESFEKLPDLLEAVGEKVQELIKNTQASIKKVEENLIALTAG